MSDEQPFNSATHAYVAGAVAGLAVLLVGRLNSFLGGTWTSEIVDLPGRPGDHTRQFRIYKDGEPVEYLVTVDEVVRTP